jgi:ATP-dependent protease ClpP protease subunit|nr:MAG TPA: Putative ATP dependent Clp protease [Caudoviricetes sp.]
MPNRDFFRIRFSAPRLSADNSEAEIMLYGQIIEDMPENWKFSKEDKSAADFDKAIKSVKESGAKKLTLRVNSPGGIVTEAVAMRGILCTAGFEKISIRIEGLCASAATIIATIPGAHVQIAPGSEYMIHNPWTIDWGNAEQFEHTAQHLRAEEATTRAFYAKKTGQTDEQIKAWMDAETWFTAEDAVKNGFCDELLAEGDDGTGKIAACVTLRTMSAMKAMYSNIPSTLSVREDPAPQTNVSNTEPVVAAGVVPENTQSEEETSSMDITNMTPEQLRSENAALYDSIMQAGGAQERQRLQDIDDLTPAGYEAMAREAKENGTSAMDYHKAIIKAQREKGQQFIAQRAAETAAASSIRGGASEESAGGAEQEISANAKEVAEYAKAASVSMDGGMY